MLWNLIPLQQKEGVCFVREVDGVHVRSGSCNVRGSQEER